MELTEENIIIDDIKENLKDLMRPFLFEMNDFNTRTSVISAFEGYLSGLTVQKLVEDFVILCDDTNNTPTRIDRNELWADVTIKLHNKTDIFYIPVRILSAGIVV